MILENFYSGSEVVIILTLLHIYLLKNNLTNSVRFLYVVAFLSVISSLLFSVCIVCFRINFELVYNLFSTCILFSLWILFLVMLTYYKLEKFYENSIVQLILFFLIIFCFSFFELTGQILNTINTAEFRNDYFFVLIKSTFGFLLSVFIYLFILDRVKKIQPEFSINLSLILFLIFSFKLLNGGISEIVEPPLIVLIKKVLETFIHDLLHIFFVIFQLPDHPYFNVNIYRFILLAADKKIMLIATAFMFFSGMGIFFYYNEFKRFILPSEHGMTVLGQPVERRIIRKKFLREKQLKLLFLFSSFLLVFISFEKAFFFEEKIFEPNPMPVVEKYGEIFAPLSDPFSSIENGMIRKFVFNYKGRNIVFFAIKRNDGKIIACLDLCEICEPAGYSQISKSHLLCKYCKTPIPITTVGVAGGCNPIPIKSRIMNSSLVISIADILEKLEKKEKL